MITAEMQRILLLVALAATAYLLILAWNDDYIKGRTAPGASSAPVVTTAPTGEAPDAFDEARHVSSDVPKAAAPSEHHDTGEAARAPASEVADRLVKVTTDTMEVWIDREGGDIVRVQLPRYPVSIEKPNDPFLLLDRRADHVYIAQSGLVGRDGPDGKGKRPTYEVGHNEFDFRGGGELRLKTSRQRGRDRQDVQVHAR